MKTALIPRLAALAGSLLLAACVSPPLSPGSSELPRSNADMLLLYVAGDIADCRRTPVAQSPAAASAALVRARLAQDPLAQVLTLGDNAYVTGSEAEFRDCYGPTWGSFLDRTHPSAGNHEYYSKDAAPYYAYFGARAGQPQQGYYRRELGGWQLFALNSNLKGEAMQAQLQWLQAELQAHPARCTLAYWHHPRYSSGLHGSDRRMQAAWDMLQQAGAELVLSGHDHEYERFAPQDGAAHVQPDGMVQFVIGTGGTPLTPFGQRQPNSAAAQNEQYGVLQLALRANAYDWQFVATDGTILDSGSQACH